MFSTTLGEPICVFYRLPSHLLPSFRSTFSMAQSPRWSGKHGSPTQNSNSCARDVFFSEVGQKYLQQRLNNVSEDRQQATPERSLSDDDNDDDTAENHKLRCELWHGHFAEHEIDRCRKEISDPHYWKTESEHYLRSLIKQLYGQGRAKADEATVQHWRDVATLCKSFLQQSGQSSEQTTELRYSIVDNKYWQPEAEVLRQRAALEEHKMREAAQEKQDEIQRRRQERVRRCLQSGEVSQSSPAPPPSQQNRRGRRVASRAKAKKTIGGGVTKHRRQRPVSGARAASRRPKRGQDPSA